MIVWNRYFYKEWKLYYMYEKARKLITEVSISSPNLFLTNYEVYDASAT